MCKHEVPDTSNGITLCGLFHSNFFSELEVPQEMVLALAVKTFKRLGYFAPNECTLANYPDTLKNRLCDGSNKDSEIIFPKASKESIKLYKEYLETQTGQI